MRRPQSDVIALVSERIRARVVTTVPQSSLAANCEAAERSLRHLDCVTLIVDPKVAGVSLAWLERIRETLPMTAFVIYADLEPPAFAILAELVRSGFTDVVLRGYDDSRERMAHLLDDVRCRLESSSPLVALQPQLDRCPVALRAAVHAMFRDPLRFRTTNDLARVAQMSTRGVFRHIETAGFASARRLVAAARVLRAYHPLSRRGRTAREVAHRLRYSSSDQMCTHFTELVGWTPAEVRRAFQMRNFRSVSERRFWLERPWRLHQRQRVAFPEYRHERTGAR